MALFLFSLVWGWKAVMFELSRLPLHMGLNNYQHHIEMYMILIFTASVTEGFSKQGAPQQHRFLKQTSEGWRMEVFGPR